MIINQNFKNKKKAEKAAALLALAADKGGEHGRCLLPEEMAALVDDSCQKEELVKFIEHLSSCETCYNQWFSLKREAGSKKNESRFLSLSRRKKYSFIGSALAVAASVVVFLNISDLPSNLKEKSLQDAVLIQPESESTEPVVPTFKLESEVMDLTLDRDRVEPKNQIVEEQRVDKEYESSEVQIKERGAALLKREEIAAPAAQSVPRAAKKTTSPAMVDDDYTLMGVDSWLKHLQKSCLSGRHEADFWVTMQLRGKELQLKHAGSLPEEKEKKVLVLLELLAGMGTESVTNKCREILTVLAEEEKSR